MHTAANIRARLRKCDSTPLSRCNAPLRDWLAASGIAGRIKEPIALTQNTTVPPCVQDDFLQTLAKDKTTVSVFLVNGIRLSGQLAGFDQFAVLLESGPGVQPVFKHAIPTVMPVNGRAPAAVPARR
ncbi:RNA chaperone Hfq [Paraburkholderia sp. MM5496-R1]|uniref:RNA chaperone Hfq n=1 Tax=unclassified Paraburkholderia TaxID=2615204 RepID=UPI003D1FD814